MAKKLTTKQEAFVSEYMIDLNATQASIRAGYSVNTATVIGCENLIKPNIKEEVEKRMAERSKRTGISQDRILNELAKMAFININDVIDTNTGEIREDANDEDLSCIESIKVKSIPSRNGRGIEREVKMASKMKALELLGRHIGMFSDKLNVSVTLPVVISGDEELED